ncbi:hypothetical protein BVRB_7g170970 [Beta vulgaris subsp. vulgaris]|nr:hypothetical protein BVRB_7g170970 [Beta vulgaris subsp. vulgaris]
MPDEEHNRGGETADLVCDEESKTKQTMKEHANFHNLQMLHTQLTREGKG